MLTNKAIYNLLSNDYGTCKRRIPLNKITAITYSAESDEFVLHCPEEYDYHYEDITGCSSEKVIQLISKAHSTIHAETKDEYEPLVVGSVPSSSLKDKVLTRKRADTMSLSDRTRHKQQLVEGLKRSSSAHSEA